MFSRFREIQAQKKATTKQPKRTQQCRMPYMAQSNILEDNTELFMSFTFMNLLIPFYAQKTYSLS